MSIEFPHATPWHPDMLPDRHHGAYIDRLAREGKLTPAPPTDDDADLEAGWRETFAKRRPRA